ncbi:DUF805 domain-containing protein [Tenacibaculum amylolyticum]|uniref:hypothetical protein n=1 Tax=Tenacibaculum amylolyticum TaxID=104269 RepID=UPI0038958AC9
MKHSLTRQTTEQLKIQTQTTTEKVKNKFTGILAVIFLVIGVTASFAHRLFTKAEENPLIIQLNKKRSQLKKNWEEKELTHDNLFKNNSISKEKYFKIKEYNKKQRISDFKKISKERKALAHDFSFNGRNSKHYWFWVFGVFLLMFIITIFSSLKDYRLYKAGLLKWYEPYSSIVFILISLFWLYHTIFKKNYDFSIDFYLVSLVVILIPLSYFLYHFIRRVFTIEEKLLENNRNLVSHVLNNTKEDKENEKWELLDKISKNGK